MMVAEFRCLLPTLDPAHYPSTHVREMNELNFQRFDAKQAQRLAELKADIIKWMFTFWAPTTLAVVALLLRG